MTCLTSCLHNPGHRGPCVTDARHHQGGVFGRQCSQILDRGQPLPVEFYAVVDEVHDYPDPVTDALIRMCGFVPASEAVDWSTIPTPGIEYDDGRVTYAVDLTIEPGLHTRAAMEAIARRLRGER